MYIEKPNDLLRWRQITCLVVHCIRTDNDITQDEVARTMHASALSGTHQVAGFHASNSLPARQGR